MELSNIATQTSAAAPPANRPGDEDAAVITSDFETFLRLLTAQLENQDPLNPLESTDFATQLATFSGVEQQVQTNDLLRGVSDALGATGIGQLAEWVGREARAAMPVYFDGAPITLSPKPAVGADETALLVRDGSGTVVQRLALPVSSDPVAWAGVTRDGGPLPPGLYRFALESRAAGEVISVDDVAVYAMVREAQMVDGEVRLVFDGGATAALDDVSGLRAAGGAAGI